jgi:hypothetical protein
VCWVFGGFTNAGACLCGGFACACYPWPQIWFWCQLGTNLISLLLLIVLPLQYTSHRCLCLHPWADRQPGVAQALAHIAFFCCRFAQGPAGNEGLEYAPPCAKMCLLLRIRIVHRG